MDKYNDTPSYYSILTAEVRYDNDLKPNEKLIYSELTALAQKEGYAFPSNEHLAKLYGVEIATVSRWLSHLQSKGYIKICIDQRVNPPRRIIINPPSDRLTKKSIAVDKKIKTSCQKSQEAIDKKVKHNNTSINTKNKHSNVREMFGLFWSAYPKKIGKGNCEKWFATHKPDQATVLKMVNAINQQKQSKQWQDSDGKYIPHPYTWLNGKRWEDELRPSTVNQYDECESDTL